MKRFLMVVVVIVLMIGVIAAKGNRKGKGFIGIWQQINDNGTMVTTAISDIDGDGQFHYRVNLDFTPVCNEPGELGRLLVMPLVPAVINADGDLVVTVRLTCLLTGRELVPSLEITFRQIDDNTILNVTRGLPFHRISAPRKGKPWKDDDDD